MGCATQTSAVIRADEAEGGDELAPLRGADFGLPGMSAFQHPTLGLKGVNIPAGLFRHVQT
jgi:hypothetical protein